MSMDILQTIIGLAENKEPLKNLLKLLGDNSFDVKKILGQITPETLAQIIAEIEKSRPQTAENGTYGNYDTFSQGLSPISEFADKEVVFALNKYLSSSYE